MHSISLAKILNVFNSDCCECAGARRREHSPGDASTGSLSVGLALGSSHHHQPAKKPRLVFTDIQRRTLLAIFCETRRPNKEMQTMIAEQLGLKVSTVANFFMNARRRSTEKYCDDDEPPAAAAASGPLPLPLPSTTESTAFDTAVDWKPPQLTAHCNLPSTN